MMGAAMRSWTEIKQLMTRPQPVTLPLVLLFAVAPLYLVIQVLVAGGPTYAPETELDRLVPVRGGWALVYASLFGAALLPIFVVHQQELVRRTINAFLAMWLVAYAFFLGYPTVGPRPPQVVEAGFSGWGLKVIYGSDSNYNCFPSLHVAQCYLAAFVCHRVHRGVGTVAVVWASLVGASTLFTKQHWALDVAGGIVLAAIAFVAFVQGYPREATPERERRLAPLLALCAFGVFGVMALLLCCLYALNIY
jgi:membrane-associated phospholipid phosphatase